MCVLPIDRSISAAARAVAALASACHVPGAVRPRVGRGRGWVVAGVRRHAVHKQNSNGGEVGLYDDPHMLHVHMMRTCSSSATMTSNLAPPAVTHGSGRARHGAGLTRTRTWPVTTMARHAPRRAQNWRRARSESKVAVQSLTLRIDSAGPRTVGSGIACRSGICTPPRPPQRPLPPRLNRRPRTPPPSSP